MLAHVVVAIGLVLPPNAVSLWGAHLLFALLTVCCSPRTTWDSWLDYQWTPLYWIIVGWMVIAYVCSPMGCPLFVATSWWLLVAAKPVRVWQWSSGTWKIVILLPLISSIVQWLVSEQTDPLSSNMSFLFVARLCHAAQLAHAAYCLYEVKQSARPAAALARLWSQSRTLSIIAFAICVIEVPLDTRILGKDGIEKASFEAYSISILLMLSLIGAMTLAALSADVGPFVHEPENELEAQVIEQALSITIPPAAFPTSEPQASGHVVLEVGGLIRTQRGQRETLVDLLKGLNPDLAASEIAGPRHYARARIKIEDEEVVREMIRAIGRQRGRRPIIREVQGTRVFHSPRD